MEVISEVEDPLDTGDGAALGDAAEADARLEREQDIMFTQAKLVEIKEQYRVKLHEEEDEEGADALKAEFNALEAKLKGLEADASGAEAPEVEYAREMRCLKLSALLLQAPFLALDEHEVAHLPQRFIPALQSPHVEMRALAVECLGLHCQASPRVARGFFTLLTKALQHDTSQVQLAALRATLDLLLLHSPAAVLPAPAEADEAAAAPPAAAARRPPPTGRPRPPPRRRRRARRPAAEDAPPRRWACSSRCSSCRRARCATPPRSASAS